MSENLLLAEHPLSHDVFASIPTKFYHGFGSSEVVITCFDATTSHIAFGTNAGSAFLYNRDSGHIIKIITQGKSDVVSTVKIIVGLDCQVAIGTQDGKIVVIIFSTTAGGVAKEVRKFPIGKLHSSEVCALEWSLNGMKLLSGDTSGKIFCTEVNFELNTCSASLIHSEGSRIVQMHYKHKTLLVATEDQVVLHAGSEMHTVGAKPQRSGSYGACFNDGTLSKSELRVFSSRPSLRLWVADNEGTVQSTLILKDAIKCSENIINLSKTEEELPFDYNSLRFGKVLLLKKSYLVIHDESFLCVIDTRSNAVVAVVFNIRDLVDVSVTKDEILILCKGRIFHRLSDKPDVQGKRIISNQDDDPLNLKAVKNSFSGFKKSFSPFVGALQTKMTSFNVKTETFAHKLQSQAQDLKKKVAAIPVVEIADHLFHQPQKSDNIELQTVKTDNDDGDIVAEVEEFPQVEPSDKSLLDDKTKIDPDVTELMKDLLNYLDDVGNVDFLHSQGDVNLSLPMPPIVVQHQSQRRKSRFDKIGELSDLQDVKEIVFSSKVRRKKKKNKLFGSVSSLESEDGKIQTNLTKDAMNDLHSHQETKFQSSSHCADLHQDSPKTVDHLQIPHHFQSTIATEPKTPEAEYMPSIPAASLPNDPVTDSMQPKDSTGDFSIANQIVVSQSGTTGSPISSTTPSPHLQLGDSLHSVDLSFISKEENSSAGEEHAAVEKYNPEIVASFEIHSSAIPDEKSQNPHSPSFNVNPSVQAAFYEMPTSSNLPILKSNNNSDKKPPNNIHSADHKEQVVETTDISHPLQSVPSLNLTNDSKTVIELQSDKTKLLKIDLSATKAKQTNDIEPETPDIYAVDSVTDDFGSENNSTETESDGEVIDHLDRDPPVNEEEVSQRDQKYFAFVDNQPKVVSALSLPHKVADNWNILDPPGYTIASVTASDNFICHITFRNRIYVTESTGDVHNIKWRKLAKKAQQIAISSSGDFTWIVTRRQNLYSTKWPATVSTYSNEIQLPWKLVCPGVTHVSLGVAEGWIVGADGKITRQVGLTRSEPSTEGGATVNVSIIKDGRIVDDVKVLQTALTNEAVWLLSSDGEIFCKSMDRVDAVSPWQRVSLPVSHDHARHPIKSIATNSQNTMWAVNHVGELWFRSKITCDEPAGDSCWQVYMSDYLQPPSQSLGIPTISMMTSWLYGPSKARGVAMSMGGVWVATDNNKLHVASGAVTGNKWESPNIAGISSSTRWSHITSSSMFSGDSGGWEGVLWLSRNNGEIIRFSSCSQTSERSSVRKAVDLDPPIESTSDVRCLSASKESIWLVMDSGQVFVRSGVSGSNPTGTKWHKLDVETQLGERRFVHLDCGTQCVWAVDDLGTVYVRIGASFTEGNVTMAAAWLPLEDVCFPSAETKFTQVACGPSDVTVWALDNLGNSYARLGITMDLPVGESWKLVKSSAVTKQLSISNHTVWALRHDGALLRRYGITHSDCMGDYWSKMPGTFECFTATPYDELWSLDAEHHLRSHVTKLYRPPLVEAMCEDEQFKFHQSASPKDFASSRESPPDDESWELVDPLDVSSEPRK